MESRRSNPVTDAALRRDSLYRIAGMSMSVAWTRGLPVPMSVERGLNSISPCFPGEAGRTQWFRQQAVSRVLYPGVLVCPLSIVITEPMSNLKKNHAYGRTEAGAAHESLQPYQRG